MFSLCFAASRSVEKSGQRPLAGHWRWHLSSKTGTCSSRALKILNLVNSTKSPGRHQIREKFNDSAWAEVTSTAKVAIATRQSQLCQVDIYQSGGLCKWIRILIRPHMDASGKVFLLSGSVTDISREKDQELIFKRLKFVINSMSEGFMDWNILTGKVFRSDRFYAVLGMRPEPDHDEPLFFRDRIFPDHQDEFLGAVDNHLKSKSNDIDVDFKMIHEGVDCKWLKFRGQVIARDSTGKPCRLIGILSDISAEKQAVDSRIAIAHDSRASQRDIEDDRDLPSGNSEAGAVSRQVLSERLEAALVGSRASGRLVGVCFIDLDRFKSINDEYGRDAGDRLLSHAARVIKSSIRSTDALAHPGGDEFIVMLNQLESLEECKSILDRILRNLYQETTISGGYLIKTSASIGVTLFPHDNVDADALIRHADQAMYAAKDAGKGGYVIFDPEGERKQQQRKRELMRLREAISDNEFVLYFQPKVNLQTREIKGVEALVRWRHPESGLILPGQFLPKMAGHQLEFELDYWVLESAIRQCRSWLDAGHFFSISVNVSAALLQQTDFYHRLCALLGEASPVPEHLIELEVLETSAISDMNKIVRILTQCRQLGMRVALDDFGTGYSSLTYLRELPVDTLKIDQSFVRDMLVDPDDLALVDGTIKLARAFDLEVVAEGVESDAHGQKLLELGCTTMQGFGIGRPMPAHDFIQWAQVWLQH